MYFSVTTLRTLPDRLKNPSLRHLAGPPSSNSSRVDPGADETFVTEGGSMVKVGGAHRVERVKWWCKRVMML